MDALLFMIFAAIAVVCGISLVLQTHPISSALSLVGVMGALAALYLLLGGEFMVLFVFVIMLLNAGTEHKSRKSPWAKYGGIPLLITFLGVVAYLLGSTMPAAEAVRF